MPIFEVNALNCGSQQQLWINNLLEHSFSVIDNFDGKFIDLI